MIIFWFFLPLVLGLIPAKDFKPDVFVLTDISNEPDDAESLVRLLLYSNELNIKGIAATTSFWLNNTIHDEDIYPILDAYEKVHPNLLKHAQYPSAQDFRDITYKGAPVYGLKVFDQPELSEGASNLINSIDESDDIFVLLWGGANVLAEALHEVSNTRTPQEASNFAAKITVYSISDQDNAGPWIRRNFPEVRYIASVHGFNQYGVSAWVGISGDKWNYVDLGGPDTSLVTKDWIKEKVQSVGPLGAAYPTFMFNMEGDTPSTLFVLPNGLSDPHEPSYGSWGGRYTLTDISGLSGNHYADATDYAVGVNGETYVSAQASIWRWREAFQNDFEARMQWTVKDFDSTVHQPIIVANDTTNYLPTKLDVEVGTKLVIDASKSYDLNGRKLTYKWFHYREPSLTQGNIGEVPEIPINSLNDEGSIVEIEVPDYVGACFNLFRRPLDSCKSYHIVLDVSNDGTPSLHTYRRFILYTNPGSKTPENMNIKELNMQEFDYDEL